MVEATVQLDDYFDLNNGRQTGAAYWFEVLASGHDPGSPQAVKSTQASFMLDGDAEVVTRYGNRVRSMLVRVTAASSGAALNDAAYALDLACDAATTLTFRMPEDDVDSVFDVVSIAVAESVSDDADLDYMLRRQRIFRLEVTCLPWARTSNLVSLAFSAGSGSVTSIDPGTATTNWVPVSGSGSPAPVTSTFNARAAVLFDTGLYADQTPYPGPVVGYDWTGTVGTGATYLVLDWASPNGGNSPKLGPTPATAVWPVAQMASPLGAGLLRSIFPYSGGTPRFWFAINGNPGNAHTTIRWYVGQLGKTTALPAGSLYTIPTPGSKRTLGSLRIFRPSGGDLSTALGVYADPTMATYGWQPNVSSTWLNAPAGRYLACIPVPGASNGDTVSLTYTGPGSSYTLSTIMDSTATQGLLGVPVDVFDLGGTRDGRVGVNSWSATRTTPGGATTTISLTNNLVLTRVTDASTGFGGGLGAGDEANLTLVNASPMSGTKAIYIDPPSALEPQGGVWAADASGVTADIGTAVTWFQYPVMTPPVTVLWLPVTTAFGNPTDISFEIDMYSRYGSYVSTAG